MENLRTLYTSKTIIVEPSIEAVLAIQRADNDRWDLAGGEALAGEEPNQTAIREVFEETGLIITDDCLEPVPGNPRLDKSIHYKDIQHVRTYFVAHLGKMAIARPKIILSHEHKDSKWVSPLEAVTILGHTVHRQAVKAAYDARMLRLSKFVEQN